MAVLHLLALEHRHARAKGSDAREEKHGGGADLVGLIRLLHVASKGNESIVERLDVSRAVVEQRQLHHRSVAHAVASGERRGVRGLGVKG
eukprot:scaffold138561_cov33-Tisochrysis_lutea.AAC.1